MEKLSDNILNSFSAKEWYQLQNPVTTACSNLFLFLLSSFAYRPPPSADVEGFLRALQAASKAKKEDEDEAMDVD